MESVVRCPQCGANVGIILAPYQQKLAGLIPEMEEALSQFIGKACKTNDFEGSVPCSCGCQIASSLHVTAIG
jgi:hypothetical protein